MNGVNLHMLNTGLHIPVNLLQNYMLYSKDDLCPFIAQQLFDYE